MSIIKIVELLTQLSFPLPVAGSIVETSFLMCILVLTNESQFFFLNKYFNVTKITFTIFIFKKIALKFSRFSNKTVFTLNNDNNLSLF